MHTSPVSRGVTTGHASGSTAVPARIDNQSAARVLDTTLAVLDSFDNDGENELSLAQIPASSQVTVPDSVDVPASDSPSKHDIRPDLDNEHAS